MTPASSKAFPVVRSRSGRSGAEGFFCEEHGREFALRAQFVISEDA